MVATPICETTCPGIATNLLAKRLRELEQAGIVRREDTPPIATTLFHLTTRGRELERAVHELGRWGGPLMVEPAERDTCRTHWLWLPRRSTSATGHRTFPRSRSNCAPGTNHSPSKRSRARWALARAPPSTPTR
ncbi:MAG: winged helix-turn-helix transcriptional regulator [Gemmatimonadetes bacterium]|nr:winged helix-turn-helix transcriptional regulator [Gemmatimonadota bacterium]